MSTSGFPPPDEGSVRFVGCDITSERPDRVAALRMVRAFRITEPFGGLTVMENIRVGAFLRIANTPREVATDPAVIEAYLGCRAAERLARHG